MNAVAVIGAPAFGLLTVMLSTLVPPTAIVVGANALVTVGEPAAPTV